jgi:gluconate 2-dehydrogenase gamma chain
MPPKRGMAPPAVRPKTPCTVDRRKFLLGSAPAIGLATLAVTGCAQGKRTQERPYVPTYFRPAEWEFVSAAVSRLIPAEGAGPGAIEAGVPEFIDRQLELPYGHGAWFFLKGPFHPESPASLGYQLRYAPREIYRLGIEDANATAREVHGMEFTRLAPALQDSFLESLEKAQLEFPRVPATTFFAQLLENTREGYFSDPIHGGNRDMVAWRWIGFPGARADFTDWIDQAGTEYPYGPVSVRGKKT